MSAWFSQDVQSIYSYSSKEISTVVENDLQRRDRLITGALENLRENSQGKIMCIQEILKLYRV